MPETWRHPPVGGVALCAVQDRARPSFKELKLANAYDPASPIKISGRLDEIDFSSGMSDGFWMFTLTISNARKESFTVKSKSAFSGSFSADKACQEVAQAFAPSVQTLIKDIVKDPRFKQIAQ